MNGFSPALSPLGHIARACAWLGLVYWGLYSLVAPVTNIDAQMYNLARLELASYDGLFDNALFTSAYHVIFPWTFDAVHLPFLRLGWGAALPSYACLVGTCFVVLRLVRTRFGPDAAWTAVVGLLGLTCLVYQGTSTKNDIPVLFCGAVWIYARSRWKTEGRKIHLVWMALAIGFMAGSKTTGLLYGVILALWTLWEIRRHPRLLLRISAVLLAALMLFGSIETYIETCRIYGHPIGPAAVVSPLKNRDGIVGGTANLVRFSMSSFYTGPTSGRFEPAAAAQFAAAAKVLLTVSGLKDKGSSSSFPDDRLFFFQSRFEELAGYGPLGTLAMVAMWFGWLSWRRRTPSSQLAISAFAGLCLVSLSVGYTDWSGRYLLAWYALSTTAVVCWLWEIQSPSRRVLRISFAALAVASALAAPFLSFNRRPQDLLAALTDRERMETATYPLIGKLRAELRGLRAATPESRIYFVACNDSVILPLLMDRQLDVIVVTPPVFLQLVALGRVAHNDVVVEDFPTSAPILVKVSEISAENVISGGAPRTQAIYRAVIPAPAAHQFAPPG